MAPTAEATGNSDASPPRHAVLIGYKKNKKPPSLDSVLEHPSQSCPGLQKVQATRAVASKAEIEALQNDPRISYIEEDTQISMFDVTTTINEANYQWGLLVSQADVPTSPYPPRTFPATSACSSESSFKIAIIDSGLQAYHPGIPCRYPLDRPDANCVGKSFDLDESDLWYDPVMAHGTHVAGIIGGRRNADGGVGGMLSDDNIVRTANVQKNAVTDCYPGFFSFLTVHLLVSQCLLIAQVFGAAGTTSTSSIINAGKCFYLLFYFYSLAFSCFVVTERLFEANCS